MTRRIRTRGPNGLSRRRLLKGAAATAGAAIGSNAITGFPTIWAQNIKDVVLHHAGPPVTAIPAIAEQATKDLGFTVQMQASENADLLNRFLSQSSAIDCADISLDLHALPDRPECSAGHPDWRSSNTGTRRSRSSPRANIRTAARSRPQGITPMMILYATDATGQKVTDGSPTEFVTGNPHRHQWRHAGHPP